MNKSKLVEEIASVAGGTKIDAGKFLDTFVATVKAALKRGEDVVVPGFGSFSVKIRPARAGRNPQTGEELLIEAKKVAKFSPGKGLKEAVQEI